MKSFLLIVTFLAGISASMPSVSYGLETGDIVEGVITRIELQYSFRHIVIRSGEEDILIPIDLGTRVQFVESESLYFSPELASLKLDMKIRTVYSPKPAEQLLVLSVPESLRPSR